MSATTRIERRGHIAILTLSNPPANVWTKQSLDDFAQKIQSLNADNDNYAVVIAGEGEKFFSAGADLKTFAGGDKNQAQAMADAFGLAFEILTRYKGVSIAAINGFAMGGGLECALACDIRIAEKQAKMALPEASVGLLPCAGGTQNLTRLVGAGWAKRMILCGERIDAQAALKIGLVEEVVETGESLTHALVLAERVKNQSPTSISACKALIDHGRHGTIEDALALEREAFVKLFDHDNTTEGVNAFLEKRPPMWK